MSAWRRQMKPLLVGGVLLAGIALLALAVTTGGCESRPFAKKNARRSSSAGMSSRGSVAEKDVSRRELDELLSLE